MSLVDVSAADEHAGHEFITGVAEDDDVDLRKKYVFVKNCGLFHP